MSLSFHDYRNFDALGLAEAMRRGTLSRQEVMDAAMARITEANPTVNAVTYLHPGAADTTAAPGSAPDAPFAGVPYLIKDLHAALELISSFHAPVISAVHGAAAGAGMGLALVAGLAALVLPRRLCHVALLMGLAVSLSLLNRAPVSAYFDQSLEVWEQGRFIRFHGLSQWLGWLWPFAAMVFGVRAVARSSLGR